MSEEQNRLDELIEERTDLDAEIEAARLLVTDEEIPEPVAEPVVTPAPTSQTALLAEIGKLEAAGKWAEVRPLKAQLVATQSGFGGLSPQTPAPAPELPTLAALDEQIKVAEAAGNYSTSSALKSQKLQNRFV